MHWVVRLLVVLALALAAFQPASAMMPVAAGPQLPAMQGHQHHQGMAMPAMVQASQDLTSDSLPAQSDGTHRCGEKMAPCCFHAPAIGADGAGHAMDVAVTLESLQPALASPLSGQVVAPQLDPPRNPLS